MPLQRPDRRTDQDRWEHDRYDQRNQRNANRIDDRERLFQDRNLNIPSAKLIVKGLHYEIGNDDLFELFERIGPTVKTFIRFDRSGRSTGVGTVIYADEKDAIRAKQEYDGANAKGDPISIAFEPIREERGKGLLERLESGRGDELSARIGGEVRSKKDFPPSNAPKGPASDRSVHIQHDRKRAERGNRDRTNGNKGTRRRVKGPPPTADSLDAELGRFYLV